MFKQLLLAGAIVVVMAVYPMTTNASQQFGPYEDVPLNKKWTITLNKDHLEIKNIDIQLYNESKENIAFSASVEGKNLTIQPKGLYEPDHTYELHLQNKLEKSEQVLKIPQTISFTTTDDEKVVKVYEAIEAIQSKWQGLKPRYEGEMNAIIPSTTVPYTLGSVKTEALQDAVNMTNFIRYLAELPAVTLNDEFNREAQGASVVSAVNQQLSHYPQEPKNMETSLYSLGNEGAQTSNLGAGYSSIVQSIQHGYMEDGDASNIDRIGHRLWILSPALQQVGFGYANRFTAMKVIADEMYRAPQMNYDAITWPAKQAMPTQLFTEEFPWSVSLNPAIYDNTKLEQIVVSLTNKTENKTWNFSFNAASDGYFNISTNNYGYLPFTIIFRPKEKPIFNDGDHYNVTITGLRTMSGEQTEFSYETTFFKLTE